MVSFVAASLDNPLVPSFTEWLAMGLTVVHLVLWVVVMLWLLRQRDLSAGRRLLGLVLATALPVIGPVLVWWVVRRSPQPVMSVDSEPRG